MLTLFQRRTQSDSGEMGRATRRQERHSQVHQPEIFSHPVHPVNPVLKFYASCRAIVPTTADLLLLENSVLCGSRFHNPFPLIPPIKTGQFGRFALPFPRFQTYTQKDGNGN
jgi:hypothetical protein